MEVTLEPIKEELDISIVDGIVGEVGYKEQHIIAILHGIQDKFKYLPESALQRVCEISDITPAQITGVSTFYRQFRHQPVGKHMIRVCTGTACHVNNARSIYETFLKAMDCEDASYGASMTDTTGTFSIEEVACLGCCALAPVAQINEEAYGPLIESNVSEIMKEVETSKKTKSSVKNITQKVLPEGSPEIRIALDSCCIAQGAQKVYDEMLEIVEKDNLPVRIKSVACIGLSCMSPVVTVVIPNHEDIVYGNITPVEAKSILYKHFSPNIFKQLQFKVSRTIDKLLNDRNWISLKDRTLGGDVGMTASFFGPQVHIATEHCGLNDPLNLDEYMNSGGFVALKKCLLELSNKKTVELIKDSGLRGRGGGGFPTGVKWGIMAQQISEKKYVICNGDEGDPGAFMDRMLLESYPFRVIEGLMISAIATGSDEGILYLRAEYPLAVKRVNRAIKILEDKGLLGKNIFGSNKNLELSVFRGAGAFICGEETAMIASIEGGRGVPKTRPPYPAQSGLWNKPTLINNVETLANISWIIRNGVEKYRAYGTESSKGTKVFALAGNIQRSGLIEVPMGTTFRQIVHDIGGGVPEGRKFKAVQIGGPSGGCIPERLADTPIDYEKLKSLGAIMGSGGLIVLDDTNCMVEIARYFIQFTKEESCGQCSIGRIGTTRLLEMVTRICEGKANKKDIEELRKLGNIVQKGSLCGLCKTAPNPLLTTLKYFPEEYEAHLNGVCPAGQCKSLIHYVIEDNCIGCTRCAQYCPTDSIPMLPFRKHFVIDDTCIRCNKCYEVCPEDAVFIK